MKKATIGILVGGVIKLCTGPDYNNRLYFTINCRRLQIEQIIVLRIALTKNCFIAPFHFRTQSYILDYFINLCKTNTKRCLFNE